MDTQIRVLSPWSVSINVLFSNLLACVFQPQQKLCAVITGSDSSGLPHRGPGFLVAYLSVQGSRHSGTPAAVQWWLLRLHGQVTHDLWPALFASFFKNHFVFHNAVCLFALCSYIFGAVTVVTGILGGALGTCSSRWFRDKRSNADPLICAVGMLGSVPCLFIMIFVASASIPATYVRGVIIFIFGSRCFDVSLVIFWIYLWHNTHICIEILDNLPWNFVHTHSCLPPENRTKNSNIKSNTHLNIFKWTSRALTIGISIHWALFSLRLSHADDLEITLIAWYV